MKFKKVVDKVVLFQDIRRGECFRIASVSGTERKVFMKIWNSAAANEEDFIKYAVNIENGDVIYFPLSYSVIPCDIEAREIVGAT